MSFINNMIKVVYPVSPRLTVSKPEQHHHEHTNAGLPFARTRRRTCGGPEVPNDCSGSEDDL